MTLSIHLILAERTFFSRGVTVRIFSLSIRILWIRPRFQNFPYIGKAPESIARDLGCQWAFEPFQHFSLTTAPFNPAVEFLPFSS
jgi:hypothetical protein